MSDEIVLRRDADRGARAQTILDNELFSEAFDALSAAYVEAWRNSDPRDTDGRERVWHAIQIVGKVKSHLETLISAGTMAQAELNALKG